MVLENYKKRKRNLSCAWIDYKKAFDGVPHEWILKSPICFTYLDDLKLYTKDDSEHEGIFENSERIE